MSIGTSPVKSHSSIWLSLKGLRVTITSYFAFLGPLSGNRLRDLQKESLDAGTLFSHSLGQSAWPTQSLCPNRACCITSSSSPMLDNANKGPVRTQLNAEATSLIPWKGCSLKEAWPGPQPWQTQEMGRDAHLWGWGMCSISVGSEGIRLNTWLERV